MSRASTKASIQKAVAENNATIPAALKNITGCVWCGPHGEYEIIRGAGPMWGYAVHCSHCGASGPGMADPMKAVSIWNEATRRAEAAGVRVVLARGGA